MDNNVLLKTIWSGLIQVWWLLPIALIIWWLKRPKTKGMIGEKIVQIRTAIHLDSAIYRPFHNLIIPHGSRTAQIDHIFVSPFGIFVVETKNYSGWIFGGAQQSQWTQVRYQQKHRFQNPLRQNAAHIRALAALLRLPENLFHSVIAFAGSDYEFKTAMPENVCDIRGLDGYIRRFDRIVLTDTQIQAACALLSQECFVGTAERTKRHIHSLNRR